jgi:NAD+ kinase
MNNMVIALFGRTLPREEFRYVKQLVDQLAARKVGIIVYRPFYEQTRQHGIYPTDISLFETHEELRGHASFLISVGGDGSMLDAMMLVRDSGIPIMGINVGRMGFLSSISREEIYPALDGLIKGEYELDTRTLVKLSRPADLFGEVNYGLNDLTVTRKDSTSLVVLHVYIDDLFLNTYWADGLIVATPTGSTAYSLSSGGPILMPGSRNFVITPIAPHNLTVRPFVIPDRSKIRILVEGRANQYMVSLDSRVAVIHSHFELVIEKAGFEMNLVKLQGKEFFATIREKLKWGLDLRN